MSESIDKFLQAMQENQSSSSALMDKVLVAALPGAVYSEPVTAADQTVITASEVLAGGAVGFGGGAGMSNLPKANAPDEEMTDEAEIDQPGSGAGGGSGSVGGSKGRPVAAIIINDEGVRIEPIVDVTKLGLAFFTTMAAILITLFKIRGNILRNSK